VKFLYPQGPQSAITLIKSGRLKGLRDHDISIRSNGMYSLINQIYFSLKGKRENIECSNHGICDYLTGTCQCYHGFKSSDGYGNSGTINDCGYQYLNNLHYNYNSKQIFTNCPFHETNGICSGHGTCDEINGRCTCNDGYGKSFD